MRVLIVGCGYVGVPLGAELVRLGHEVFGLRRSAAAEAELKAAGIQPLSGDVTRPETLAKLPREFDWVVNCVAAGGDAENYRQIYLQGTRNLIEWLAPNPPKKFVYTSSTSVYGQTDGSQVKESSPTEPLVETAKVLLETEKNLLAAHNRQPMAMPESVKNIGLLKSSEHLRPAEIDPAKLAADYVKHLEQYPLDTEIREMLAIIYADHYQRLDLATGELEQLIEAPKQPPKRVAHWLNLLADLQIRHGADYDTVRGTLEKIVERFPDLAVAEMARMRLARLKTELKGHQATPDVKLGVYEQNLGLKRGRPGQF